MLSLLIVILVSIVFSAFFSGMEIAFLSSNKLKLEIEKKHNPMFSYIADLFSRHPGQYITTILVGNNIALVVYSLYMSLFIRQSLGLESIMIGENGAFFIETLISTIVIIFCAEFIPKAIVKLDPNFYYKLFALPGYVFYLILYPISKIVTLLSVTALKLTGSSVGTHRGIKTFDKVDLAHLIEDVADADQEHENEKDIKLFQNALDFSDLKIRDCMVPRIDIEAIDIDSDIEALTRQFIDTRYSRILVYKENIDNIIGYVNSKSLFNRPGSISEIMKSVEYVPESMSTQKTLTNFIKKHHSVAVVIDEFGGTAGMITIEDVLEEIFGEIEDEHDSQDMVEKKIGENEFIFSGRLEVEYLNEKYNLEIPESDEYETLAGYIIYIYEDIPQVGDVITTDNKSIKILRLNSSKLELVRITALI